MLYSTEYPDYMTTTCLDWKPILRDNCFKDLIIESLRFLVKEERVVVYAFVLMENHFHLIWQIMRGHKQADVQRDFLKYTGQKILMNLRNEHSSLLEELMVGVKDRKRQVWERNSLSIPLWTQSVLIQKLNYIHNNPVRAGLCQYPEDYPYSSARFYICSEKNWDFLSHYDG